MGLPLAYRLLPAGSFHISGWKFPLTEDSASSPRAVESRMRVSAQAETQAMTNLCHQLPPRELKMPSTGKLTFAFEVFPRPEFEPRIPLIVRNLVLASCIRSRHKGSLCPTGHPHDLHRAGPPRYSLERTPVMSASALSRRPGRLALVPGAFGDIELTLTIAARMRLTIVYCRPISLNADEERDSDPWPVLYVVGWIDFWTISRVVQSAHVDLHLASCIPREFQNRHGVTEGCQNLN